MRPATIETRFQKQQVRASEDGKTLFGRALNYGVQSELIYGYFTEEPAPGCFDESLQSNRDVYCTIDHDMDRLLGRQSAGTLKLIPDEKGIAVECSRGEYSYAADLVEAIRRNDLRGMSFIFDVLDQTEEMRDGRPHRTVTKADLYEVSFVFFPAYPQTEAGVRAALPSEGQRRALDRLQKLFAWRDESQARRRTLELLAKF